MAWHGIALQFACGHATWVAGGILRCFRGLSQRGFASLVHTPMPSLFATFSNPGHSRHSQVSCYVSLPFHRTEHHSHASHICKIINIRTHTYFAPLAPHVSRAAPAASAPPTVRKPARSLRPLTRLTPPTRPKQPTPHALSAPLAPQTRPWAHASCARLAHASADIRAACGFSLVCIAPTAVPFLWLCTVSYRTRIGHGCPHNYLQLHRHASGRLQPLVARMRVAAG